MNTLIFIRHGETDMAGRFCGHSDPELNAAGELQVARVAEEVAAPRNRAYLFERSAARFTERQASLPGASALKLNSAKICGSFTSGCGKALAGRRLKLAFRKKRADGSRNFPCEARPKGKRMQLLRQESTRQSSPCSAKRLSGRQPSSPIAA